MDKPEEYRISNKEFRMKKVETLTFLVIHNTDATTSMFFLCPDNKNAILLPVSGIGMAWGNIM